MHKKFEINLTKIKGGCQSGRKVVAHNFKSDLPLVGTYIFVTKQVLGIQKLNDREGSKINFENTGLHTGIQDYRTT